MTHEERGCVLDVKRCTAAVFVFCGPTGQLPEAAATFEVLPIASDETWLLAMEGQDAGGLKHALDAVAGNNADVLVADISSGVTLWSYEGDWHEALASRSEYRADGEGFIQGLFCGVPCKLLLREKRLLALAPASLDEHFAREAATLTAPSSARPVDAPATRGAAS